MKNNLLLFALFALIASCISSNEDIRVVNINEFEGEGSYLPIKSGQTFIIEMEGNPSTGSTWILENADSLNKGLLTPLNLREKNTGEYFSTNTNEEGQRVMGRPGIYRFKFQANNVNSGSDILHFVYKRLWEAEVGKRKSINVKIVNSQEKEL